MPGRNFYWKNSQIRKQIDVIDGKVAPTIVLRDAKCLHPVLKEWLFVNVWIFGDRIVYVGKNMPNQIDGTEIIDCSGKVIVPGYIEPHAHPFQLYNPQTLAAYASRFGTTTLINDNLVFVLQLEKKKAFTLIDELKDLPTSLYWWSRFDSQTELEQEEDLFSNANVSDWLKHEEVLQGGELTSWPRLLAGDDLLLDWIRTAKHNRKPVEGHFPGASAQTLTKMQVFGVDGDHEAMTGEDVYQRLLLGYMVTLRNSSIRPDLENLLNEMHDLGVKQYDRIMMTTDGSTPAFYSKGMMDELIRIAMKTGVPEIDAYNMASFNIARHFHLEGTHGIIAPGRIAHINILEDRREPTPISVLAKGEWVLKEDQVIVQKKAINWSEYQTTHSLPKWELTSEDLQYSMPLGIEMVNDVITKPYSVNLDLATDTLEMSHNESFLSLFDQNGKWRINTIIKGFATGVSGFASSYSNSGDFLLIGKKKDDMQIAFKRMRELAGGIVLVENGEIIYELELPVFGMMSSESLEVLIEKENDLKKLLLERGYSFKDPIYSLLFLSSVHLPFVRITPRGIVDVKKKKVLFPTIMR